MLSGLIDLHSHVLPGIDDGCSSLDESVALIRRLKENGFTGSVCTPHYFLSLFPDNTPSFIENQVQLLAEYLQERNVEYQLWPGGEVRLHKDTIAWFETAGVPVLGTGRCVLVDHWGDYWPSYAGKAIDYLLENDFQPILAHPERMNLDEGEMAGVLLDLRNRGVYLQGNLNSLSGGEGRKAQEITEHLLDTGSYHVIASDSHHPEDLGGRLHGLQRLCEQQGEDEVALLMHHRPGEILALEA